MAKVSITIPDADREILLDIAVEANMSLSDVVRNELDTLVHNRRVAMAVRQSQQAPRAEF